MAPAPYFDVFQYLVVKRGSQNFAGIHSPAAVPRVITVLVYNENNMRCQMQWMRTNEAHQEYVLDKTVSYLCPGPRLPATTANKPPQPILIFQTQILDSLQKYVVAKRRPKNALGQCLWRELNYLSVQLFKVLHFHPKVASEHTINCSGHRGKSIKGPSPQSPVRVGTRLPLHTGSPFGKHANNRVEENMWSPMWCARHQARHWHFSAWATSAYSILSSHPLSQMLTQWRPFQVSLPYGSDHAVSATICKLDPLLGKDTENHRHLCVTIGNVYTLMQSFAD